MNILRPFQISNYGSCGRAGDWRVKIDPDDGKGAVSPYARISNYEMLQMDRSVFARFGSNAAEFAKFFCARNNQGFICRLFSGFLVKLTPLGLALVQRKLDRK